MAFRPDFLKFVHGVFSLFLPQNLNKWTQNWDLGLKLKHHKCFLKFFHPILFCHGISMSETHVWLRIKKHFFYEWRKTFTILVASFQLLWFLISYEPKQKDQMSGSSPPGATFRFWISWVVQEELAFTFPHLRLFTL